MATAIKAIPAGYEGVTPYLVVKNAAAAIDFYKKAFGATELMRYDDDERIGHAELQIGEGRFMLADEYPEMGFTGPRAGQSPPVSMMFYVKDVDAVVERAKKAGATIDRPVADQFYSDRSGQLTDPFGHRWTIATHVEDVSPEEMERRAANA